jgi:hypothetical protein
MDFTVTKLQLTIWLYLSLQQRSERNVLSFLTGFFRVCGYRDTGSNGTVSTSAAWYQELRDWWMELLQRIHDALVCMCMSVSLTTHQR